jgi:hypothetical protein
MKGRNRFGRLLREAGRSTRREDEADVNQHKKLGGVLGDRPTIIRIDGASKWMNEREREWCEINRRKTMEFGGVVLTEAKINAESKSEIQDSCPN